MRISVGQILILLTISFLLFGDVGNLKKKIKNFPKKVRMFLKEKKKDRKKRI